MYILYYKPNCPYCQKVLAFAEEENVEFDLRDIHENGHASALVKKGGKKQVPFLVDEKGDIAMYESDDIIAYLTAKMDE